MTDGDDRARTLGERLDDAGRRLSARHMPAFPWAAGLARVFTHAAELSAPHEERFERVETPPNGPAVPLPAIGGVDPAVDVRASFGRPPARRPRAVPGPASRATADRGPGATDADEAAGPDDDEYNAVEGRPLPADVRSRLRAVAGPAADAIRVHDDSDADARARAHRADAVTVGRDVHFRAGRYADRQERAFGLLAHEAVHVMALLRPPAGWRRGTLRGIADEEGAALAAERAARAPAGPRAPAALAASNGSPPPARPVALPAVAVTAVPAAAPAAAPMRAAADREAGAPAATPDLEGLRRSLVEDLMRRLRAEFERGA